VSSLETETVCHPQPQSERDDYCELEGGIMKSAR